MSKINILDSTIYNRISAGEVVERPYSVVKELVENAIDAKSDKITIEIIDGGITSIKISDNGTGIEKDDLTSAVLPHATSKISCVDDLDFISTLGFRGEALASIASVSRLKIVSKTNEQEFGAMIYVEGGKFSEIEDYPTQNGTEVTVNNLFFNTPARQKFLKSAKAEEGDISSLITRFILGNPNISFKYIANGKTIYQSYGDGLEACMVQIYGTKIIQDCFYIDTEKHGIKISGYIGKHHFTKPNRTYQSLFLNGRFIVNNTISSAVMNAYSSYLMKRQYPFYVLNIQVPTETVDVNVHPNKSDVRFSNNQIIYGSIYSVISKVLDGVSEVVDIVKSDETDKYVFNNPPKNIETEINKPFTNDFNNNYVTHNNVKTDDIFDFSKPFTLRDSGNEIETKKVDIFEENKKYLVELEKKKIKENTQIQTDIQKDNFVNEKIELDIEFNVIGQALNTYLILDDGNNVYLIDQHAAHERVLYDKFLSDYKNKTILTQPMLVPYVLNLTSEEFEFITEKIEYIKELGIEIEDFGYNSFKITTIPAFVSDINLGNFFNDLLSDINILKRETLPNIIIEKIAQKACKAACKAGDSLTKSETEDLLKLLKYDLGLKCPHGRPISVKITKTEIEKWFKRIV